MPDADYCSPEDLKRSPLLIELPIETVLETEEEAQWKLNNINPINKMHEAQNNILNVARTIDSKIENFNDLYKLLLEDPATDIKVTAALRESGYLDLWKFEINEYPWRYNFSLMNSLAVSPEDLRHYCVATVKEAYSGNVRFASNLVQLRTLKILHPREYFRLEVILYETLVQNDQMRRETAYDWLMEYFPDDLKQNMEQIEPHSKS